MKLFLKSLIFITCLLMTMAAAKLAAQESRRQHRELDDNWRFYLGDLTDGAAAGLDDSIWRTVTLPDDWSVEGKMDPKRRWEERVVFFRQALAGRILRLGFLKLRNSQAW